MTYPIAKFDADIGRAFQPNEKPLKGYDLTTALRMELTMLQAMNKERAEKKAAKKAARIAADKELAKRDAARKAQKARLAKRSAETAARLNAVRTRRENVTRLNAEGKTTPEIAKILGIRSSTVSSDCHVMRLKTNPVPSQEQNQDAEITARRRQIIEFLRNGPRSTADLAAHVDVIPATASKMLRRMATFGQVKRVNKIGLPAVWSLTEAAQ